MGLLVSLCFSETAKRIISLSPYLTEELYLLGVEERLIACTTYCKVENKERVGSIMTMNLEKIVSLKPDLVFATDLTNKEQIKRLKDLGINVFHFPYPKNFSSLCEQFIELGRLVSKEKEAKKIIKRQKKKIETIRERVKGRTKPRVIVQIGASPLWISGKNSTINEFIEYAGGINIGPPNNAPYSIEEVVKANPDVIIIMEMGITGEEEKKNWQRFKIINAVKKKRIYFVDSYELGSPTPVSFPKTLEKIARILHSSD